MSTFIVSSGSPVTGYDVTSGNTLEVASGGIASSTTVETGGTLQVDAGGSETGAVISTGGTENIAAGGSGGNDTIYGAVNVGAAGGSTGGTVSNEVVAGGGVLTLQATGDVANNTTINAGGSVYVTKSGTLNNLTVSGGGTVTLNSAKALISGTVSLVGSGNKIVEQVSTISGGVVFGEKAVISGFNSSDVIDNSFLAYNSGTVYYTTAATASGFSATLFSGGTATQGTNGLGGSGGTAVAVYNFASGTNLALASDPSGNTEFVCYVAGTRIRTVRGDVAIETLAIGDLVVTASGVERPIKWLGHRTVDCRQHPNPHLAHPIRIAAHAFGEGRPARDLFVSPGHAICVDVVHQVLIPASCLVNGATIRQTPVEEVAYWHIELESHDILLSENLPTESYLDMGNRGFFKEADVVDLAAGPDVTSERTHADFCRQFVDSGPILDAVKAQVRRLATDLGWTLTDKLELHLEVDGLLIEPVVRGLTARFLVPAGAKDVWLASSTARPCDVADSDDNRELGLYLEALQVYDGLGTPRVIAIDDPLLCIGFHEVEAGARRWTSGRARLPAALWEECEDAFLLRLDLAASPVPRWKRPSSTARLANLAPGSTGQRHLPLAGS